MTDIQRQWIADLRSGRYTQCYDRLKESDTCFCAGGLFFDVLVRNKLGEWVDDRFSPFGCIFDQQRRDFIQNQLGKIDTNTVLFLNDKMKLSFTQIADTLEEVLNRG